MRRSLIIVLGVILFVGMLAVAWFLASPLFIDRAVNEPFPVFGPSPEQLAETPEDELISPGTLPPTEGIVEMAGEERKESEDEGMQITNSMPEEQLEEAMPTMEATPAATQTREPSPEATRTSPPTTPAPQPTATTPAEPVLVAEGSFYGVDEIHHSTGDALIYESPDSSRFIRFENFEVANGPQLHVILGVEPNPYNLATLGDYLDLGPLKGNIGDQNYEIPEGTDLNDYGSVVIYCVPFRAIFAIAPIK